MQLHEVLEKFLDDDNDMHRLHLTAEGMARQSSLDDTRKHTHKPNSPGKSKAGPAPVPEHEEAADRQGVEGIDQVKVRE